MTKSKAAIRASNKYDAKTYDRVLVLFPRGTKDRITSLGFTVNGFTVKAVLSQLDNVERSQGRTDDSPAE